MLASSPQLPAGAELVLAASYGPGPSSITTRVEPSVIETAASAAADDSAAREVDPTRERGQPGCSSSPRAGRPGRGGDQAGLDVKLRARRDHPEEVPGHPQLAMWSGGGRFEFELAADLADPRAQLERD